MKPVVDGLRSSYIERVTIIAVRVDLGGADRQRLIDKYGVAALPTYVFVRKSGTEHSRIIGQSTKSALKAKLEALAPRIKATMSRPSLSVTSPKANQAFTIRGTCGPAHVRAAKVKLYFVRKVGPVYKAWSSALTATTRAGSTSYSVGDKVAQKGSFGVRAYHSDSNHLATYGKYLYFTVK